MPTSLPCSISQPKLFLILLSSPFAHLIYLETWNTDATWSLLQRKSTWKQFCDHILPKWCEHFHARTRIFLRMPPSLRQFLHCLTWGINSVCAASDIQVTIVIRCTGCQLYVYKNEGWD
jgi:hypothetical protein